jgi:hypothetical protein
VDTEITRYPKGLERLTADARGPFARCHRRGLLAGRQTAGVGIVRQDGQAVGRGHGSAVADARGLFVPRYRLGLLAGRQAAGVGIVL